MFIACTSKWTVGPMGGYVGLDDARITNVMRYRRVKDKLAMFEDLRVMEAAARAVLNAKS